MRDFIIFHSGAYPKIFERGEGFELFLYGRGFGIFFLKNPSKLKNFPKGGSLPPEYAPDFIQLPKVDLVA